MVKFSNPREVPSLSGPARLSSMDNNPHGSNPKSECVLPPQIFNFTPLKIKKVSEMEFTLSAANFKEFEGYVYRLSWFMNTIDSIMASLELTPEGIAMSAESKSRLVLVM